MRVSREVLLAGVCALLPSVVSAQFPITNPQLNVEPTLDLAHPIIIPYERALDVRPVDMDADGDADLLYWGSGDKLKAYRNLLVETGQVSYEEWPSGPQNPLFEISNPVPNEQLGGFYDLALVDIDGDAVPLGLDRDLDIVAGTIGEKDRVFEWDAGVQRFRPSVTLDHTDSDYWCCADPDPGTPFQGCRSGANCEDFTMPDCSLPLTQPCPRRWTTGVAYGDIDLDGDIDVAFCHRDSRPSVYYNDGTGFTLGSPLHYASSMDPPCDEANVVLCPDGTINCEEFNPFPGAAGRDIHLVDLNMDGYLDCVVDRRSEPNPVCGPTKNSCKLGRSQPVIYLNTLAENQEITTGTVVFAPWYKLIGPNGAPGSKNASNSLEVGDVNDDGYPDVIVPVDKNAVGDNRRTRIYLNDGTGIVGVNPEVGCLAEYRPTVLLKDGANHGKQFAGLSDIDSDGHTDVVSASSFQGNNKPDKVFKNLGNNAQGVPQFAVSDIITNTCDIVGCSDCAACPTGDDTRYVRWADVDNDGDHDYLEANFRGSHQRIYLNLRY